MQKVGDAADDAWDMCEEMSTVYHLHEGGECGGVAAGCPFCLEDVEEGKCAAWHNYEENERRKQMPRPQGDIIRVFRLIQYIGPRGAVERQVGDSLHGSKRVRFQDGPVEISATTIGEFAEALGPLEGDDWLEGVEKRISAEAPKPPHDDDIPF
jgi:hypothetical protein